MIAFAREKVQEIRKWKESVMAGGLGIFLESFFRGMLIGLYVLLIGGYGIFRILYFGKVLPGLTVSGVEVSGQSVKEALYILSLEVEKYVENNPDLILSFEDRIWTIPIENLGLALNDEGAEEILLSSGRSGSALHQLSAQWQMFFEGKSVLIPLELDEVLLNDFVSTASTEISNPAIPPRVYRGNYYNPKTKSLIVAENGVAGDEVLVYRVLEEILKKFSKLETTTVPLSTSRVVNEVTEIQLENAVEKAKKLLGKSLIIERIDKQTKEYRKWTLFDKDLISFLSIENGFETEKIDEYVKLISETVNRPSQNALFQFDKTNNRVVSFKSAKNGLMVQTDKLRLSVQDGIGLLIDSEIVDPIEVEVHETEPVITNSQVNNLGIETLLGHGESTYYHSSASRRHNVEYAAGKLNGVLVPPGEEFSFNKALGEVSQSTGFKQAMIIKEGRTLLDDGGGVCQDSTTIFRAILDAGLPITSWRNHSFRVGYYEQNSKPGFDATVFSPAPDLRFINDTSGYILIQTRANNMKLEYDLFGTDDGRKSTISNYAQWDASPPPPDLYQDDPTLPVGEIKKVESAVPGLKTKFDYTVTRDGEVIYEKTFYSVYQPWQAVYLRGTGG